MIQYRRDLWQLVKDVPGDLAELGVAEALFSRDMLEWPLIPAPRLFLVDRWKSVPTQKGDAANPQAWHDANLEKAQRKTSQWSHRVTFMMGDSVEMAKQVPDRSLRLVYIDACHTFEAVTADNEAWYPKLVPGGVMAWHDHENISYGVKEAVARFCKDRNLSVNPLPEDALQDAGAWTRKP